MAREEDHDDLAEIFNHQSEVQTDKFGEFFIADMIAMQNQTRYVLQRSVLGTRSVPKGREAFCILLCT